MDTPANNLHVWDSAFVRARRRDVHPLLRDVAGYQRWWPGARTQPAGQDVRLRLRGVGLPSRTHTVTVRLATERPDKGLELDYRGDLIGSAEWYYLDESAGVVVHYLLKAAVGAGSARRLLRDHRAAVRSALQRLKDGLEAGRRPGQEPAPGLLVHQRTVIAMRETGRRR